MKRFSKKSFLGFFIIIAGIAVAAPLFAFGAGTVTINPNIPGTIPVTNAGPGAFVANFYQFALLISGLLALGAIVYGGVKYAASAGNPSAQSDGKEWVLSAIYGLLLLAGAYLILYTINPNLTQLNLPALSPINITAPAVSTGGGGTTGSPTSGPTGARCQAPASGPCSVATLQANGGGCFGNNITAAAGVCNVESGNNAAAKSGTDKCADGSPVSFGLFQVNITANQIGGLNCPAAFDAPLTGHHPTCNIVNQSLYNQCVAAALSMSNNIAKACALSSSGQNWSQWGPATRAACGF